MHLDRGRLIDGREFAVGPDLWFKPCVEQISLPQQQSNRSTANQRPQESKVRTRREYLQMIFRRASDSPQMMADREVPQDGTPNFSRVCADIWILVCARLAEDPRGQSIRAMDGFRLAVSTLLEGVWKGGARSPEGPQVLDGPTPGGAGWHIAGGRERRTLGSNDAHLVCLLR
jgi:hypothetical protein